MGERRGTNVFEAAPAKAVASAPPSDKERFLNVRMPERILHELKVYAAQTGQTQKDIVQQLVVDFLRAHGRPV